MSWNDGDPDKIIDPCLGILRKKVVLIEKLFECLSLNITYFRQLISEFGITPLVRGKLMSDLTLDKDDCQIISLKSFDNLIIDCKIV